MIDVDYNKSTESEPVDGIDSGLLEDAPLDSPQQDRLGRASFAKFLAKAILETRTDKGFVFALYGAWGSGKSSTLNFVVHYINELSSADNKPIIVQFNPWWFSGQDHLLLQFFRQLSASLGKPDESEVLKRLGALIQTVAKFLKSIELLPIPVAKDVISTVRELIQSYGEAVEGVGKQKEKDVSALKRDLEAALRKLDRRILVVIDDVDRLPADEIWQMFRLIKAVADFPKTIYLLAFDREIVASALKDFQGDSGEMYLKKIVQAPFDLPMPNRTALRRLLFEQLDMLLVGTPEDLWDEVQWSNVYWDGIDSFIRTPRDIKRFVNALHPTYPIVRGEVNPVDFLGIEALRVFVPPIYEVVRSNKESFTGSDIARRFGAGDLREQRKPLFDRFLESVSIDYREAASALLKRLFPKYASVFGGAVYGPEWEREWRKQLRVCSPDVFPVFFRLSLEEGAISSAEMRALLGLAHDSEALAREIVRLASEPGPDGRTSRAREFLERLEGYTREEIPLENIETLLQALYDAGNALIRPEDRVSMLDIDNSARVLRVTYQLLQRFPSQQERFDLLSRVFSRARSLPVVIHKVVVLRQEHGKYEYREEEPQRPEGERTVGSEHLAQLERIALQKIKEAVQTGVLSQVPDLSFVLSCWQALAEDEPVRNFVKQLIATDMGFTDFLTGFLQLRYMHGVGNRVTQSQWVINIQSMQKLVNTDSFGERVERILAAQPEWLTDRRRLALEVFIRELSRPTGHYP
jgi:predicted KAP-like P-loop ATPase